jgi:hypothetical protein
MAPPPSRPKAEIEVVLPDALTPPLPQQMIWTGPPARMVPIGKPEETPPPLDDGGPFPPRRPTTYPITP